MTTGVKAVREVTAAEVHGVLATGMDALVLNEQQAKALHNPASEDPDSVIELIDTTVRSLRRGAVEVAFQQLKLARAYAELAHQSNTVEGVKERQIVGWADKLAGPWTGRYYGDKPNIDGRSLAGRLRPEIRRLNAEGDTARAFALMRIFEVFDTIPEADLFSGTVTSRLGTSQVRRLRELHAEWQAAGEEQDR
jgi:hypothetical protein